MKEKIPSAGFHQIEAEISLPSTPELMEKVLPREKLLAIFNAIGEDELKRLSLVEHGNLPEPVDYNLLAKREGVDLEILRKAIRQVTGSENPWIIGFASDFAKGLLKYVENVRS